MLGANIFLKQENYNFEGKHNIKKKTTNFRAHINYGQACADAHKRQLPNKQTEKQT